MVSRGHIGGLSFEKKYKIQYLSRASRSQLTPPNGDRHDVGRTPGSKLLDHIYFSLLRTACPCSVDGVLCASNMATQLLDSESSGEDDGGVILVNEAYAERYAFNKKREERMQREEPCSERYTSLTYVAVESKHGKVPLKRKRDEGEPSHSEGSATSTTDSEDEDEDEDGEFATEVVDAEIQATLDAIRSKDPRIYDTTVTFYTQEVEAAGSAQQSTNGKPMFLRDYHRQNLLHDVEDAEVGQRPKMSSYAQEQNDLKDSVLDEIKHMAADEGSEVDVESEQDFLTKKPTVTKRSKRRQTIPVLDVENADRDPDLFLSNFMQSRAWTADQNSRAQPFESDDDEEERQADDFEEGYNFRFEDPEKSNEKLQSHARHIAEKYSVRREDQGVRQKHRDRLRVEKDAEKHQLRVERERLRKLKIEDAEEKVRRIKRAAGLSSRDLKLEDWARFVDEDWDDAKWNEEMQKRFGDSYYTAEDQESEQEGAEPGKVVKRRRPKWDDDIDITDLVPDFQDKASEVSLSDEENAQLGNGIKPKRMTKEAERKESRKDRRIIESLVDGQLDHDHALLPSAKKSASFRYRDTSPNSFGLSSMDILLADDTQLNQYAGLKKLAAFRDPDRKTKDKRLLSKSARLRQWRQETFGHGDAKQAVNATTPNKEDRQREEDGQESNSAKKKRRRGSKRKLDIVTAD